MKKILLSRVSLLAVIIMVIGAAVLFANRDTIARHPTGAGNDCQSTPAFVKPFKLAKPYFDTSRRDRQGLVLVDSTKPDTVIQKPNWRQYGNLGSVVSGKDGVAYTANVPVINTLSTNQDNHLAILRLDPKSGDLQAWTKLEGAPLSAKNYYGITSLAYDCSSGLLYVAAVAGSTDSAQNGFIAAIDTVTASERFRYNGIDALGIGIYGGQSGRYIYLGLARSSDVVRLKLTDQGKPFGEPEHVLNFDELGRIRARKLEFKGQSLTIDTTEFYYNLVASTEFQQQKLIYHYDKAADSFEPAKNRQN